MSQTKPHFSRKRVFRLIAALFSILQLSVILLCKSTDAGTLGLSTWTMLTNGTAVEIICGIIAGIVLLALTAGTLLLLLPNATRFTGRLCALFMAGVQGILALMLLLLCWLGVGAPETVGRLFGGEHVYFVNYLILLLDFAILGLLFASRFERIAKKVPPSFLQTLLVRLLAILGAIICSMLMVLMIGYNPLAVFAQIYKGSIGTANALTITLERSIPMVLGTMAVIVAFKMHFWNVGVAGQLTVGAVFASFFAYRLGDTLPHAVLIPLMFLAGAAGGAIYAFLPAYAKIHWHTSETLFALMLNYISTYIVQLLRRGPWEDPMMPSFGQCAMFVNNARLTKIFGCSSGWIVAVLVVIFVSFYLRYTKHGFEIRVVGEQEKTAEYLGVPVKRVIVRTMLISGAIAGIAGMLKISGADFKLNETVAGDIGFTVITVAWLVKLNPLAGAVVAVLFTAMTKGCESLSMSTTLRVNGVSIPSASATVIIGILLLFVLGCEFFLTYRIIFKGKRLIKEGAAK